MPNYPAQIDTTLTLPTVVDNFTPVQGIVFNRLRDTVIAIETELGVKPSSIYSTVRNRLTTIESSINNLLAITVSGDLQGNLTSNIKVIGIHGNPISSVDPQLSEVLTWNGIAWEPADPITNLIGLMSTLIYRPGGTPLGNVYDSWTALMTVRDQIDGPVTIVIDNSLVSPTLVDIGDWDFKRNTKVSGYLGMIVPGNLPVLQLPDGAHIHNPSYFENITLIGDSISTPSIDVQSPFISLNFEATSTVFYTTPTATKSLFTTPGDICTIDLYGYAEFINLSNGFSILDDSADTNIIMNLYDDASIDGYTLGITGAASIVGININSTTVNYNILQNNTATTGVSGLNLANGFRNASIGAIPSKSGIGTTSWSVPLLAVAKGTSTLSNGTANISSSYTFVGGEQILLSYNTVSGSIGSLTAAASTRVGQSFTASSRITNGTIQSLDNSTIDWIIVK